MKSRVVMKMITTLTFTFLLTGQKTISVSEYGQNVLDFFFILCVCLCISTYFYFAHISSGLVTNIYEHGLEILSEIVSHLVTSLAFAVKVLIYLKHSLRNPVMLDSLSSLSGSRKR